MRQAEKKKEEMVKSSKEGKGNKEGIKLIGFMNERG